VIDREMDRNYAETNPASAVLHMESVDDDLVALAGANQDVVVAEARREFTARLVQGSDDWIDLRLVVVEDFDKLEINRFFPDEGAWAPTGNEILIERSSLDEVDIAIGDEISVATPVGGTRSLTVVGLTHDPGRTPAWMTGQVVGYIGLEGLAAIGVEPVLNELRVIVAGEGDRAAIGRIADSLVADLEVQGAEVLRVDVPAPGEHPAQGVMRTMLFLLQAFGGIALISSGALVATLITTQLRQQSHEIGVMKAIGAGSRQIASIYLGSVALLSFVALAVGIPIGALGGRGFVAFTFGLLNFEVSSYRFDLWVVLVQVAAALGLPLLAVLSPVLKMSRVPVNALLSDHGAADGAEPATRGFLRLSWLRRTTVYGLRNALRTPSRTVLTVIVLSMGGAAFMVALNTGVAWDRAVVTEFEARDYTLEIQLDRPYGDEILEQALGEPEPLGEVELWNQFPAAINVPGGGVGDTFRLLVPPQNTTMVDFPIIEGRWLRPDDEDVLVVTQFLDDPAPDVGSTVTVEVGATSGEWMVVGVVRQLTGGSTGLAYASNQPDGVDAAGSANQVRIGGSSPSSLGAVEDRLAGNDVGVVSMATAADGREALDDHLLIIVGLLMIMAILIAIVGGLGLVESMSISVLERRRELGVMRAVGASNSTVLQVVLLEGLFLAFLSWLSAVLLSVPATLVVETITGQMFAQAPLDPSFSAAGIVGWLAIVTVLAAFASAIPALETIDTPVHQVLVYE
ncbi:MAG: FtsX-like permease family protein, partial [Acidimicrobiia bacterium]|nr:FtsX-like permease family protein [Acidimicrobiia bacterium]